MNRSFVTRAAIVLVALTLWGGVAAAQSVQDVYKGKTIQLAIGFGPGAEIGAIVRDVVTNTSPQVVARTKELLTKN